MLNQSADHLPDVDFVDWGLERLQYDVLGQSLEVALEGPPLTDWQLESQFGRVAYLMVFGDWLPYRWDEYGSDEAVVYFGEEPSLSAVEPHLRSWWGGVRLRASMGSAGQISTHTIAPVGVQLRAFVLVTNHVTVQWLCAEVRVESRLAMPPDGSD